MSIDFYYSDKIEDLFQKLNLDITKDYSQYGLFEQPIVFVPNPNVKKWLQINSARQNGICINVDYKYLEEGLTEIIKKFDRHDSYKDYIFLGHKDNHIYLQLLITSLIKRNINKKDFSMINDYVYGGGKKYSEEYYIKKIWQLSEKLEYYFREYEYNRSEMIENWENENYKCRNNIEKFQRELYGAIFFDNKFKEEFKNKIGKEYITLPQYSKKILKYMDKKEFHKICYVFSFSQVSRFHYELICDLSRCCNFKIYYLNYNRNFFNKDNNLILDNKKHYHSPWLKSAEESINVFFNLSTKNKNIKLNVENINMGSQESNDNKVSLLKSLQDFLQGKDFQKIEKQDTSFQIINAPAIYREIETVYNSILHNLNTDKNLKLTDIAILAPDISKYKSVIKSVFARNPVTDFKIKSYEYNEPFLPYNLSDTTASEDSVFATALIASLNLAKTNYNRTSMFELILNPCFMASQNIDYDDAVIWLGWIDKLNIYHDYISNPQNDIHTWSHGLKALRLGRIMKSHEFNGELKCFNNLIPFNDIKTDDEDMINTFVSAFERLFEYLEEFKKQNNVKKWIELISNFINEFLKIPEELEEENSILYNIMENLNKLELFGKLLDEKINIEYIIRFIKGNLLDIKTKTGKYLADGITISSLVPMRPIPFKIVYIIGMNEDAFPGSIERTTLDLRNLDVFPGDVNKIETNQYLFYEIFMSIKQKLYISYIGKDIEKDRILYPSNIINKLINLIDENILVDIKDNANFKVIEIPLKQESDGYFMKKPEYQDVLINYSFEDSLLALLHLKGKGFDVEANNHVEEKYNQSQGFLKFAVTETLQPLVTQITVDDLKNFIINPADIILKKHFSIYLEDGEGQEELILKEDEPFYTGFPDDYKLITGTLDFAVKSFFDDNSTQNYEDYYENFYSYRKLKGATPAEIFSIMDKDNFLEIITGRFNEILSNIENLKNFNYYSKIIINENFIPSGRFVLNIPVFKITLNDTVINITGEIDKVLLSPDKNEIKFLIVTTASVGKNKITKHVIKPLLSYLLLMKEDQIRDGASCEIMIFYKDKVKTYTIKTDKNDATSFIEKLITDYLDRYAVHLLPFNLIVKNSALFPLKEKNYYQPDYITILEEAIEESREDYQYLDIVKPVIPHNAYEILSYRYKIFQNLLLKTGDKSDE